MVRCVVPLDSRDQALTRCLSSSHRPKLSRLLLLLNPPGSTSTTSSTPYSKERSGLVRGEYLSELLSFVPTALWWAWAEIGAFSRGALPGTER